MVQRTRSKYYQNVLVKYPFNIALMIYVCEMRLDEAQETKYKDELD